MKTDVEIVGLVIDQLKRDKRYIKEVNELERSIEKIKGLITDYGSIKNDFATVQKFISVDCQKIIDKFQDEEIGPKHLIVEITRHSKTIDKIKSDIISKKVEITNKLRELNADIVEINKINKNAKAKNLGIENFHTEILNKKKKIDNIKISIDSIITSCNDIKREVVIIYNDINSRLKEITNVCSESIKIKDNISIIEQDSKNIKENIEGIKKESEKIKNEIFRHYKIASDAVLSGSLGVQSENLNTLMKSTEIRIMCSAFVLFIIIICESLFHSDLNIYSKIAINLPIVYMLLFYINEYYSYRKSYEIYKFKSTIALSLEAHTALMLNTFGADKIYKEKIIDFSIKALNNIYNEPYLDSKTKEFYNVEIHKAKAEANNKIIENLTSKDGFFAKIFDILSKKINPVS